MRCAAARFEGDGMKIAEVSKRYGVSTDTLRQNKSDIMTRNLIRNMRKDEKLIYEKLS